MNGMTWLRSTQGTKTLYIVIACLFVSAVSSVGQVNAANRHRDDPRDSSDVLSLPGDRLKTGGTGATTTSVDPLAGPATTLPGLPGKGGTATTPFGNAPIPKYGLKTQGVTDKEVKLGVSYNTSGCGDSGALSAALGEAVTGDPEKAFDAMVRYINDNGGVNGRKLTLVVADDGGGGCPEKAGAAAVKLVDQDKVFAVVPGLHDVSDYSIAKKIPTMIGREDEASLKAFGPNGFGLASIASALKVWSSFGAYYIDSKHHVPCLIHPDDDEWNGNEKTLNRELSKYGIAFKSYVRYADDVSTAQQQATAAAVKFRNADCDQVYFMAHNPIALIFFTAAASQAGFNPDVWTFTSYTALADTALAGNLMNNKQWEHAIGLSYRVPPGQHPAEGNCQHIYEHYYPGDGQSGSASVQLACALVLPPVEMMRRGERLTGQLSADSFVAGANAITNDYYFDATVPMDWSVPLGGPYKTKAFDDWTVVKWNEGRGDYDFPDFPLYWKVMGPNKTGGTDLRPLFKKAS
jgi:ABC-type branched-subunit amino acid transport system substrate-binding protein